MRALLWLLVLLLVAFGVSRLAGDRDGPDEASPEAPPGDEAMLGPYPRSRFYIEHDRFLPATDPETLPGKQARFLGPDAEVFGIVLAGRARAYPVPMISYHHVVNDVLNGVPVAVTY